MRHDHRHILALFVPALAGFCCAAPASAAGDIIVAAPEAQATVAPGEPRLKLVNLPALEFELRAAFKCKGEPVSVTLSVADTFRTLGGDDLKGLRAAEVVLTVPPRQLALAANENFCVADDPDTTNELLVRGLTTVHASLRCAGDTGPSVHYASAPLAVKLICSREADAGQEAPASSEAR